MSRSDYERVAAALREARDEETVNDAVDTIALALSRVFAADNDRFNPDRFMSATEV